LPNYDGMSITRSIITELGLFAGLFGILSGLLGGTLLFWRKQYLIISFQVLALIYGAFLLTFGTLSY
jgi:hypothetical protein